MRRRWLVAAAVWVAAALPSAARANVLLIGDSIFWGVGAFGGANGVAFQLQRELKGLNVFNYSAPGATMGSMLAPVAHSALYFGGIRGDLRLAVIALGVNDWRLGVDLGYFSAKYEEFVTDLQTRVQRVACVAPLWTGSEGKRNKVGATVEDYRLAISRVCSGKPGRYFWNAFPAVPGNRHFFLDGLHPNRHGHRRYAKWLRDRVRETLPKDPPAVATRRTARLQPPKASPPATP